ncbi:hypothetical protein PC116_g32326 [Phytophthora cactorum]|nr:hypothetical protein PC116_g32326 [Phytophthora cactorum]
MAGDAKTGARERSQEWHPYSENKPKPENVWAF